LEPESAHDRFPKSWYVPGAVSRDCWWQKRAVPVRLRLAPKPLPGWKYHQIFRSYRRPAEGLQACSARNRHGLETPKSRSGVSNRYSFLRPFCHSSTTSSLPRSTLVVICPCKKPYFGATIAISPRDQRLNLSGAQAKSPHFRITSFIFAYYTTILVSTPTSIHHVGKKSVEQILPSRV
jgi:hypothetical protein